MQDRLKVGAFQLKDIQGDIGASLDAIEASLSEADEAKLKIVCFPECFLQGYTFDEDETRQRALNLTSTQFDDILKRLESYHAAAIIGMIEVDDGKYFNTAIVIHNGKLLGKYRKVHLFEPNFQPGTTCPVFVVNNIPFGINICYDARFAEGAAELKRQGAQVIFYPLNNRLPTQKADNYREKHIPNLIARAEETGCWIVSADVYAQEEAMTSYGCTAIVSPDGKVVGRVTELTPGMIAQ